MALMRFIWEWDWEGSMHKGHRGIKEMPEIKKLLYYIDKGWRPAIIRFKGILFRSKCTRRGPYISYEDIRPCKGKTLKIISIYSVFEYQNSGSHFITPASVLQGCSYGIFIVTHHKNLAVDSFRLG